MYLAILLCFLLRELLFVVLQRVNLERAGLGKLVKGLPNGLDTLVGAGFGGQTDLSGGQWQRLALARLIYQDAPVMILDEPVASLDPEGDGGLPEKGIKRYLTS